MSFAITVTGDHRDSLSHCYVPNVRIKDINVLIDGKSFFNLPVKDEEEAYEEIISVNRNNDHTTGNLLNFAYFKKKNYKLIAIDLIKQTKLKDLQQISFIGRLLAPCGATMFFITKKSEETTFEFLQNSANIKKVEAQKIVNLVNSSENEYSKFATKKWYVIDSESKGGYLHEDPIKFLT